MWLSILIGLILTFLIFKYGFINDGKGFWRKRGVREVDASEAVSSWDIYRGKKDNSDKDHYAYELLGESKFCGMIEGMLKVLLVKDLDLLKKIMIKDFDHFVDTRDFFEASRDDSVLRKILFSLKGDEWKRVRAALTPSFTTAKIRRMMEYFNSVATEWTQEIRSKAEENNGNITLDLSEATNAYSIDVIALIVFGIKAEAVKNPHAIFRTMAERVGNVNWVKLTLSMYFPGFFRLFGISIIDDEAFGFFEKLWTQGIEKRLSGAQEARNDFLQLLIEAKTAEDKQKSKKPIFTDKIMLAQSVQFFFAGFRTTSHLIAYVLYALALHPEAQNKVRKEVDRIFKSDGTMEYDHLVELSYLDMVVAEVQRMFPTGLRLERMCVKDYYDPESRLVAPKGCMIAIPINSINYDKRYYKNPETFDPERFSVKEKTERNPFIFMPFGAGPRSCIGMRFALANTKAAVAYVIRNFTLEPSSTTPVPMQGAKAGMQSLPVPGLELNFICRKLT